MEQLTDEGEIQLCHRDHVEGLRRKYGHILASHSFASLYLWRKQMGLSLYKGKDIFTIKYKGRGDNVWFFPCGEEEAKKAFLREHMHEEDFRLCYLGERDVDFLEECFPEQFLIRSEESACEYIYSRQEHLALEGSRYAHLRRQLRKATKSYTLRTDAIMEENLSKVLEVIAEWNKNRVLPDARSFKDYDVGEEGILHRSALGITGILVYVNDEPYGVSAGYPLTGDTYDIFLQKQKENLPGLPYYVKREFFLSLPEEYLYINGEEDLGIEGLRMMKKNLQPCHKNKIWEAVTVKNSNEVL